MKLRPKGFALIPHKCELCHTLFWFEKMFVVKRWHQGGEHMWQSNSYFCCKCMDEDIASELAGLTSRIGENLQSTVTKIKIGIFEKRLKASSGMSPEDFDKKMEETAKNLMATAGAIGIPMVDVNQAFQDLTREEPIPMPPFPKKIRKPNEIEPFEIDWRE